MRPQIEKQKFYSSVVIVLEQTFQCSRRELENGTNLTAMEGLSVYSEIILGHN